ncbi:MAG: DUF4097 domain-containing protein [Treponema sp.]|nr:DUF4097 domain-containing protein [Treponema sp.]
MTCTSAVKIFVVNMILFSGISFQVPAAAKVHTDRSTFPVSEIREIDVGLASEELEICSGNVQNIEVEIVTNRKNGIPVVTLSGNSLKISKEPYFELRFYTRCVVRITVPEDFCADELTCTTSSGSQSVQHIKSMEADFNTSSGSITCESLHIQKVLEVRTSSGSIGVKNSRMKEITCRTSSGSIRTDGLICSSAEFESSSGAVGADGITADVLKAQTSSGGILCSLKTLPGQESRIESASGDIRLKLPENDGFSVSADTTSGTYRNEFTGAHQSRINSSLRDVYKSGIIQFVLKAASGSISVEKI